MTGTYPSGTSSTAFSYDNADLNTQGVSTVNQTCGGSETLTQAFSGTGGSRNPDGQVTQDLSSYSATCSGQTSYQRNYSYDLAGRVVYQGPVPKGGNPFAFAYDNSGDLTTISSHDVAGNFDTYTQTYDAAGETTAQTPTSAHGSPSSYSYDALGDQTATTFGTSTTAYTYNQAGQLAGGVTPATPATSYLDDGDGLETFTQTLLPAWTAPASIDASRDLRSVSCPTATFCAAVDASEL